MDFFRNYHQMLLEALEHVPTQFDELERVAQMLANSKQVVCIGVGKSGFVAQKLNASLASISLNSIYLHPAEALHGDIGVVNEGAVAVIFSKSGNSAEINDLLPFLKKRSCHIVAVCNRRESPLGKFSGSFLDIATVDEGEPLNILPLISIDMSMVIANMLIARVAETIGLTVEAFSENHPGGQLGRNVTLVLDDLHNWKDCCPFVDEWTSVMDAIAVDSKHRAGLVCILDSVGELLGVLSDGDIRRAIRDDLDLRSITVVDLMNRNPVTLRRSMLVGIAIDAMEAEGRKVFSAPVIDADDRCSGVVTLHDLIS